MFCIATKNLDYGLTLNAAEHSLNAKLYIMLKVLCEKCTKHIV